MVAMTIAMKQATQNIKGAGPASVVSFLRIRRGWFVLAVWRVSLCPGWRADAGAFRA